MDKIIYKYNIAVQFFILMGSLLFIVIAAGMVVKNYQDAVAGKLTISDYICLPIVAPLIGMMAIYGIAGFFAPLVVELQIGKNGLRYETITYIIESQWNETYYERNSIFGEAPRIEIIIPVWGKFTIKPWAKFFPYKIKPLGTGIPLSLLGVINAKILVEQIHSFAPYLFHETRTVGEFILALNALDDLVHKCVSLDMPFERFIYRYWAIENRCILSAKGVPNIELMKYLQKHAHRIEPHQLIYEKIIKETFFYEENEAEEVLEVMPREPMSAAEGLTILQRIAAEYFQTEKTSL